MSLANRLQELRKKANLSQEQLADKLEVTRQAISKWESDQGNPDITNLVKLSEIYQVTTDYILKGIEPQPTNVMNPTQNRNISSPMKKALAVLLVVAGTAVVTVIFISALALLR